MTARRVKPDRATMLLQGLQVLDLLRQGPAQTETISRELGIPQRTTERILSALRGAPVGLITEVRGKERWHLLSERPARSGTRTPEPLCTVCGLPENVLSHSLTFGTRNGNHAFVAQRARSGRTTP